MGYFITFFERIFGFLVSNELFEIPILVWLILPSVIALIVKFIQGKK